MANKVNKHVERMLRYLPLSAAHDQIYEEYQKSEDSLNLETQAFRYLLGAVRSGANLVILTGDAGHGKTHLCRRLIEEYLGYDQDEARQLINLECDGRHILRHLAANVRPLRIHKDFSEMEVGDAVDFLSGAGGADGAVTVVCANEGRLRAVLQAGRHDTTCRMVLERFEKSFEDGLASADGATHIINLNYQSVSCAGDSSLLSRTLQDWLDKRRWIQSCSDCDSSPGCPIFHNRNMLADGDLAPLRRKKLEELFATLERLGVVVTIREMLMAVSFLLTGGQNCRSIHPRSARRDWQHRYAYYNLLFSPGRPEDKLSRIPVLLEFPRLDPGALAARDIDDRLVNAQTVFPDCTIDLQFPNIPGARRSLIDGTNGIDQVVGNPRNAKERRTESDLVRAVLRSLRRRAFFDEGEHGTTLRRLGFETGDDFRALLQDQVSPQRSAQLKNRLIAGLHAVQGLRMPSNEASLHLVDPAFGRATSQAAIIARRLPARAIRLLPMRSAWPDTGPRSMPSSVDWIDRYVVFRVDMPDAKLQDLPLDLMTFDCLIRAGYGHLAEDFYAHDLRRVTNFLGKLAELTSERDQDITLFLRGSMHSVSIDQGVVQVGGGL
ncbi:hypothetical protein ACM64Y_15410 [Novispirillum sp. DQ9]|uniref:hypothetical protein n=1 Tax=Novispirillum sp. DQ9 TaxID=3398612 RepID=UPI003C7A3BAB